MVHKRALASVNTQQTIMYTILKRNAILANTHQGSLQENMFIESKCSTVNMFVRETLSGSCLEADSCLCFYLTCTFSEWFWAICLFVCLFSSCFLNKFKKDCWNWKSFSALFLCKSLVLNPICCHLRSAHYINLLEQEWSEGDSRRTQNWWALKTARTDHAI